MAEHQTLLLRVRDWDAHYENNRTRGYKRLGWVPIPNRHDGDAYTELADHPNGAAHLGAWIAIVQVASRCEPRGVLLRDGGRPHDAASLARITRLPVEVFNEAIPRLLSIGWLERQDAAEIPQDAAVSRQSRTLEKNRTEQNRNIESSETRACIFSEERVEDIRNAIGAHRGRGDVPDPEITRRIAGAFTDEAALAAWIRDLHSLSPTKITGAGYGFYEADARRWVAGKRTPGARNALPPAVPSEPKFFDLTRITGPRKPAE